MKQNFSILTFVCIVLLILFAWRCKNDSPVKPTSPPAPPDTTSHDYTWTVWEVGRLGTHFDDVFALSPDFAIAVGYIQDDSQWPVPHNCYIWNGTDFTPSSLPINDFDTVTINPTLNRYNRELNSIWIFRRDNLWYSVANSGCYAHTTILKTDTSIKTENYAGRPDLITSMGRRILAYDSCDIFFGGIRDVVRYRNGSWTVYGVQTGDSRVGCLWGSKNDNVFMSAYDGSIGNDYFYHFDGNNWKPIWTSHDSSLSDSMFFGAPISFWGAVDDDSMWISGLWLGRMKKDGSGRVTGIINLEPHGANSISGSSKNNVFFVGYNGAIIHYNGSSFNRYEQFYGRAWKLNKVFVLPNDVFIAGEIYGAEKGILLHGKRK